MTHADRSSPESATETHREPHGAASPHGRADDIAGHDVAPDHDANPGHGDHSDEALGPLDVPAWLAGIGGAALGLIVVACLALATRTGTG